MHTDTCLSRHLARIPRHLQQRIQLYAQPTLPVRLNDAIVCTHTSGLRFAQWLLDTLLTMSDSDRQHDNMLPTPFPKIAPFMFMEIGPRDTYHFQPFYCTQSLFWYKKYTNEDSPSVFLSVVWSLRHLSTHRATRFTVDYHPLEQCIILTL